HKPRCRGSPLRSPRRHVLNVLSSFRTLPRERDEGSDGHRSLFRIAKALFAQQLASIHCLGILPSGHQVSASDEKIIFFHANSLNVAFLSSLSSRGLRRSFAPRILRSQGVTGRLHPSPARPSPC